MKLLVFCVLSAFIPGVFVQGKPSNLQNPIDKIELLLSGDEVLNYQPLKHEAPTNDSSLPIEELLGSPDDEVPSNVDLFIDDDLDGLKRVALQDEYLWPNGIIPYRFDTVIGRNLKYQNVIMMAMKEWSLKTCIQFVHWSEALKAILGHSRFIYYDTNAGHIRAGCWSHFGTIHDGGQQVGLELHCIVHKGILHELGHTIGLHHEQNRPDRDDWVTLIEENIQPHQMAQYEKTNERYPNGKYRDTITPYDYKSIMHYSRTSFGKYVGNTQLTTMIPHDLSYLNIMGMTKHVSFLDHKLVNTIYKCTEGCDDTCDAGCYATKNGDLKECHCVCEGDFEDELL